MQVKFEFGQDQQNFSRVMGFFLLNCLGGITGAEKEESELNFGFLLEWNSLSPPPAMLGRVCNSPMLNLNTALIYIPTYKPEKTSHYMI